MLYYSVLLISYQYYLLSVIYKPIIGLKLIPNYNRTQIGFDYRFGMSNTVTNKQTMKVYVTFGTRKRKRDNDLYTILSRRVIAVFRSTTETLRSV